MKNKLNIEKYFASPIGYSKLSFDLKEIETFCYHTKMIQEQARNKSNRDGWQSTELFFPNSLSNLADKICEVGSKIFYALDGSEKYTVRL